MIEEDLATINKKNDQFRRICGLCGKKDKGLTKTECCEQWICDDEGEYKLFSYARNSCSRNHRRFTLCAFHHNEDHKGDWKICKKCLKGLANELEIYVWYGTNEYNFEKLENPPKYDPTYCDSCGKVIHLSLREGGYSTYMGKYHCHICSATQRNMEQINNEKRIPRKSKSEINKLMKKVIGRREELEKEIPELLIKLKSKHSFDDVKKFIYNEEEAGGIQDILEMFTGGDFECINNKQLQTIMDAWNYLPHKSLNDKCPHEMLIAS